MAFNDKIQELSQGEFENYIKKDLNVVQFFAEWCMPCMMMIPVTEELSEKFNGKIKFSKINIDDNRDLAKRFKIKTIPHFLVFKDGEQVGQQIGSISSEEFEEKLREFFEV